MAEGDPNDWTAAGDIGSFLAEHVRANPGLRFGDLVLAARGARHVSQATIARHLARLVRLGDLTLLPDRTYVVGDPSTPSTRATVEVRWHDIAHLIRRDGSARVFMQEEFRIVSGELDHLEFRFPRALSELIWWCTTPGRLYRLSGSARPDRFAPYRLELSDARVAQQSSWQRFCLNATFPKWYRMASGSGRSSRDPVREGGSRWQSESVEVRSQTPRVGYRLAPDAHLRLQVIHPEGYPVGPARARVHYPSERERIDPSEEVRIKRLGQDELHQDGLRRFGTTLTLSVPRPRLDRVYEVAWMLPTADQRKRWLRNQRRSKPH